MEMKKGMKGIARRIAVTAIAVAVVFGGIRTASVTAEAKGTAFIDRKTSRITPTVKSAKWFKGKINVMVSVPASKVKNLGKVRKITVAYGSTRNSKKFEAVKAQAKVTKKGKNQYTFTISSKKLNSYRNTYMTVKFDGKTNWSRLAAVKDDPRAKRDKDGTYTSAIFKRFDMGVHQGCNTGLGTVSGVFDDGDGWIYVKCCCTKCNKCGKVYHGFTDIGLDKSYEHECFGNWTAYPDCIAFDKETGRVVTGSTYALKDYPVGTFFMDVY